MDKSLPARVLHPCQLGLKPDPVFAAPQLGSAVRSAQSKYLFYSPGKRRSTSPTKVSAQLRMQVLPSNLTDAN